jgi:hypothetical protein
VIKHVCISHKSVCLNSVDLDAKDTT